MIGEMLNLPKPPRDITPAGFFEEWLPTTIEPVKPLIGQLAGDLSVAIGVRITGDDGGDWTGVVEGGDALVEKGLRADAVVTFILTGKNFIDAITGRMDDIMPKLPEGGTGNFDPAAMLERGKNILEALKTIEGSIGIEIEDEERPYSVMVKFAGELKDKADCIIKIDRIKASGIVHGDIDPQRAFMSGQVKFEGNSALVMQLLPILM